MIIKLISAVALDGSIGKDDTLLWNIPEDLQHYKTYTLGKVLIVGAKTYFSLPMAARKNRLYLVVGAHKHLDKLYCESDFESQNNIKYVAGFSSPKSAIEYAKSLNVDSVTIVGGAMLYHTAIEYVDICEITWVHEIYDEANKHFPIEYLKNNFDCVYQTEMKTSNTSIKYQICTYIKKRL